MRSQFDHDLHHVELLTPKQNSKDSAGRVKTCPVAAMQRDRDRAKVWIRSLPTLRARTYRFPW